MIAHEVNTPTQHSPINPRPLGTLGMAGAPMLLVEGLYRYFARIPDDHNTRIVGLLGLVYICGWAASATGMRRLRVAGRSIWSASLFVLQMIGLSLAGLWSMQEIVHLELLVENSWFNLADAAWPLSHLFMLVVAFFVLGAGRWRGWRRWPPFVCGLALPAFFVASALAGREVGFFLFAVMTTVGFMSLGYAVRTSDVARDDV